MAIPVKLRDVVAEMDAPDEDWVVYLNRRTGEMVTVTPEDRELLEDPSAEEDAPAWQLEHLPEIREAVESPDYLELPDKFTIHEWSIMERFAGSLEDERIRERLDREIHRHGAFGRFREALDDLGLREEWYRYRESALEEIAASWLEENGIPFVRDVSG